MRFIYSSQLLVSRETLGLSRILMFLMSERVFVLIGIWFFYSCFIISQILIVSRETKKEGTYICLPGK